MGSQNDMRHVSIKYTYKFSPHSVETSDFFFKCLANTAISDFLCVLPSLPAYLPHHSSLSILGNAFLAPSRLAAAERARSDPDVQPGPVFWLQPPSCSPVEEVNFADGAAFCEGEANKTPKLKKKNTQETSGDKSFNRSKVKVYSHRWNRASSAPLRPPQTAADMVRAAVDLVERDGDGARCLVGLLASATLALTAKGASANSSRTCGVSDPPESIGYTPECIIHRSICNGRRVSCLPDVNELAS